MKKIIFTILFSMLSTTAFANSGKINLEGFGSWDITAINAGKGDLAITYDGIASMKDKNGDQVFNNVSVHCVGGLTTQGGNFADETGMCRFDLFDGESVFIKYTGSFLKPLKVKLTLKLSFRLMLSNTSEKITLIIFMNKQAK